MAKSKTFKKIKRKILNSGFVLSIIVCLAYWYLNIVAATTKWQKKNIEKAHNLWKNNKNTLIVTWHGRALMIPFFRNKKSPFEALVSPHNDGRIIAMFLKKLNINPINGSTNDNARSAAINIMRSLHNGNSVVLTPDGPRGPRMKLGISTIYFAQKTGVPIIAASYSIKNAKIIHKSWDNMMVPIPFSKGMIIASDPVYIPKDASPEELEDYRLKVEKSMIDIQNKADDFAGIPHITQETKAKLKKHERQN